MISSFVSELEQEKNINVNYFAIQQRVLKRMESEYGIQYYLLLYSAIFTTLFIISYMRPPKFYRDFISKIFNLSFKWRGIPLKIYNLFVGVLLILGILLIFLQMIAYEFSPKLNLAESYENKMYRLKYKWMLETQIWLLSLVIIEIAAVYRLASIYDEMSCIKENINNVAKKEKSDKKENLEYLPTKESMRFDTNENTH